MADKKITELTAATNHATSDLLLVVKDAAGTPTSRSATFGSVFANVASPVTVTNLATFRSNTSITSATATISANTSISGRLTVHEKIQTDGGATIIGNNGALHANNTITAGTITVPMLQETPLANTAGRALIDTKIATTVADDVDPFIWEAYYSFRPNDSIEITPGIFGGSDSRADKDDDIFGAVITSTFKF